MQRPVRHLYEFGSFQIDVVNSRLLRDGQMVPLKPKVFDTLLLLVEHSERVLSKDEMMSRLWPNTVVEENNLTQNISILRRTLGEGPNGDSYIETIPKRGYRFAATVREVRDEEEIVVEKRASAYIVIEQEEEGEPQEENRTRLLTGATGLEVVRGWIGPRWKLLTSLLLLAGLMAAIVYVWNARSRTRISPPSAIRTIAVLPLKVVNAQSGDEYLGVGIADRLVDDLSKLREVVVRPTSAVLRYAGKETEIVEAGRELSVEAVLSGSVQMSGQRMRTSLQLVRIIDGEVLWVKNFDGRFEGIFALQDEIADHVTRAMHLELREEEKRQIANRGTESAQAYQAYMRGRFVWNQRTPERVSKAIDYFQQAVSLDNSYALAYTGLADCYALSVLSSSPLGESYQKAKSAVMNALAIDDSLAEAHTSLAWIKLSFEWDWAGAEQEFRRAIELNPNYPTAHHWYGIYLSLIEGKYDESLAEIGRAQELDPTSLIINANIGTLLSRARRDDEAIAQLRKTVEMDPNFSFAHLRLGVAYAHKGMYEQAVDELQKAIALNENDPFFVAQLGAIYAMRGQKSQAMKIVEDLTKLHTRSKPMAGAIAAIYADLNDKEKALEWLTEAYEAHDPQLWLEINGDRRWDILLSDARFTALLQRMGFQSANTR
jgi:DNA-binding winged helix-turn-helix (wHTH) protein/TolB-like protein/Tfp pilus assembly protein PilF